MRYTNHQLSTEICQSNASGRLPGIRYLRVPSDLSTIVIGSRVEIYWPLDKVYCPATIVAKNGKSDCSFTIRYDGDGVTESIDLSREKFKVVEHDKPQLSRMDAGMARNEAGGMWTCFCGAINPPDRKRCSPPCRRWKVGFYTQKTSAKPSTCSHAGGTEQTITSKRTKIDSRKTSPSGRPIRGSEKQILLSKVGIGSRVGIYWECNRVYFPATIISKHKEDDPYTYTFLYDDGDEETFDLSTNKFQLLDDDPPEAAIAMISAASS